MGLSVFSRTLASSAWQSGERSWHGPGLCRGHGANPEWGRSNSKNEPGCVAPPMARGHPCTVPGDSRPSPAIEIFACVTRSNPRNDPLPIDEVVCALGRSSTALAQMLGSSAVRAHQARGRIRTASAPCGRWASGRCPICRRDRDQVRAVRASSEYRISRGSPLSRPPWHRVGFAAKGDCDLGGVDDPLRRAVPVLGRVKQAWSRPAVNLRAVGCARLFKA